MNSKLLKLGLAAGLVMSSSFAQAQSGDDDLLNILDGQSAKTAGVAAAKTPLRKLLGKTTAEQNIFFSFLEAGDFEKALFQFSPAFERTEFIKSANGQALRAYLLFQNGMPVAGLESLLDIKNPKSIQADMVQIWRQTATEAHPAWNSVWVENWNPAWTEIFGVNAEIQVRSRMLDGFEQGDVVKDLMVKSRPGTKERALLQWQLALSLVNKDTSQAAQALAHLIKQEKNPIGADLMDMTAARMLFQNGYMDAAIKYYSKVPRKSDYWFEAQEEMGWSYIRKGQPQDALSTTKALTQPYFASLVGPEASFLRSLAQLKVCDYTGTAETLKQFGTDFRPRTAALLEISKNANTPDVRDLVAKRAAGKINFVEMGPTLKNVPRWAPRDQRLGSLINFEQALAGESKRAGELYARSLSNASDRVGFQASLDEMRNSVEAKRRSAEVQVFKRVQDLAKVEVEETREILSKMHVVEAEMLSQASLVDRVAKARPEKKTELKGSNDDASKFQLKFPVDNKEVWFDEIAHYSTNLKGGCEARSATVTE